MITCNLVPRTPRGLPWLALPVTAAPASCTPPLTLKPACSTLPVLLRLPIAGAQARKLAEYTSVIDAVTQLSADSDSPDSFSILGTAVGLFPDLVDALSSGEWTVFAPTNGAMLATLEELKLTVNDLVADRDLLKSILTFHVLPAAVPSSAIRKAFPKSVTATTVGGGDLTIRARNKAFQSRKPFDILGSALGPVQVVAFDVKAGDVSLSSFTGPVAALVPSH